MGSTGTTGMAPFFGCRSIIGGIDGNYSCGNCAASLKSDCSYQIRSDLAFARASGDFATNDDLVECSVMYVVSGEDSAKLL